MAASKPNGAENNSRGSLKEPPVEERGSKEESSASLSEEEEDKSSEEKPKPPCQCELNHEFLQRNFKRWKELKDDSKFRICGVCGCRFTEMKLREIQIFIVEAKQNGINFLEEVPVDSQ
eukprot:CAMPEP_0202979680 /NCGR_PEP_ID=MMETSP1396-20130829/85769_1 /ASSEMBLY_ACC=CAM_ASM_000872 /TAXON_ID= /ORGANISM="Pseudokeronopsis sp., Strain Brazil" /LENGTH=118 /DNA_ID=CAMNT_0049719223 /DNA_START=168 /DNA_END=524 /DNA_ORIENTATION=+